VTEVRNVIAEMTTDPDTEREYELRHADCVIDIPQSGERFDRAGMRQVQRNFPGGAPQMQLARLGGGGDVWVAELVSDHGDRPGGGIFNVCVILEFKDGKVARETRYYPRPSRRRRSEPSGACPPRADRRVYEAGGWVGSGGGVKIRGRFPGSRMPSRSRAAAISR